MISGTSWRSHIFSFLTYEEHMCLYLKLRCLDFHASDFLLFKHVLILLFSSSIYFHLSFELLHNVNIAHRPLKHVIIDRTFLLYQLKQN